MAKNNVKNRKSYTKEIREAESKPKKSKWRELIEDILLALYRVPGHYRVVALVYVAPHAAPLVGERAGMVPFGHFVFYARNVEIGGRKAQRI